MAGGSHRGVHLSRMTAPEETGATRLRAVTDVVWRPDEATLEHANVTRLLRRAGVAGYPELVRRSVEEPAWFWRRRNTGKPGPGTDWAIWIGQRRKCTKSENWRLPREIRG